MKDYYGLIEVAPTASTDEIRRAFRGLIARYHPDKVQHLGKEFQAMAADRAAELTEAYRILSDAERRAAYDSQRDQGVGGAPSPETMPAPAPPSSERPNGDENPPRRPAAHEAPPAGRPSASQFSQERASRDAFVRQALVGKLRHALALMLGPVEEPPVRGFDVVAVARSKLFSRAKHPRFLARFVPLVDTQAVAETWGWAGRWDVPAGEVVCVILMGFVLAPSVELADAIARQRRQAPKDRRITLIPVDARDWQAHVPTDAPATARQLLDRLRQGE